MLVSPLIWLARRLRVSTGVLIMIRNASIESEIKEWMTKVGLSDFKRFDQPFGTSQIIGVK